jgi:FG-GAP-like repeat/ASPIC and UnbV
MRGAFRLLLAGIFCMAVAVGVVIWATGATDWVRRVGSPPRELSTSGAPTADPNVTWYPDPNAPGSEAQVCVDRRPLDLAMYAAFTYKGAIRDPSSLAELRDSIRVRGARALAAKRTEYDRLRLGPNPTYQQALTAIPLAREVASFYMHEGDFGQGAAWLKRGLDMSRELGFPPDIQAEFHALLGIAALRRGEIENCLECLGPSSCIFPIDPHAVHVQQDGSREAIRQFTEYLKVIPGDLRFRWLLNVAYMTVGEYPEKVPRAYLIPLDRFRSKREVGAFHNVAPLVGLGVRGPGLAGGCIFDDFDGDDLPDLFTTSLDVDRGASLFINRGDGTFDDRSAAAGLDPQVYVLNLARADYDNDGNPDVVLLRGAWERPGRLSLLRNKGAGVFEDVTLASGLGEPISSESAAWGDYDDDGWLDLFVCGETQPDPPNPRQRCRLYHNQHDGTFKDVAPEAGVAAQGIAKGSAWGDYDDDGRLDLFVSYLDRPCRLYHNEGNGTFRDVAREKGVAGPPHAKSFSCWFFDYDNDGRLDLYVNDNYSLEANAVAYYAGVEEHGDPGHPHLYHNLGADGFRDVSAEAGLVRPLLAMGSNFGDIDNDGYPDIYLGTGEMSYHGLVPNVMLLNVEGRRFEDVTDSSRTGHLQKGHGVSFADWDCDGDLDVFCVLGGGFPGDQAHSVLFQNPGHGRHWLKVKLVGTRTNRSAIGTRIRAEVKARDGSLRSIHRVIGNNGSFGGNSLVEFLGLGDATSVSRLTITWPRSRIPQVLTDIAADQLITITEGTDSFKSIHQSPLKTPDRREGDR